MNKLMMMLIVLIPVFTGCSLPAVHVDHSHHDLIGGAALSHKPIEIIGKNSITKPYSVIGEVSVRMTEARDADAVFDKLRAEANRMGGDALMDLAVVVPMNAGGLPEGWVNYTAEVISFDGTDLRYAQK